MAANDRDDADAVGSIDFAASLTAKQLAGPDAHALLRRLRAERPVCWLPAVQGWLVTRHDLAIEVMRDDRRFTVDDPRFSTARVIGTSMLSLDGPEHRRHRSPFIGAFRPSAVAERYGEVIHRLAYGLAHELSTGGERRAELRSAFAGPLSVLVLSAALGVRDVDVGVVLGWYRALVEAVQQLSGAPRAGPPETARAAMRGLAAHIRSSLRADDGAAGSVLRDAAAALDETSIVGNAAVMMFGGIETTEGMIVNAVAQTLSVEGERARLAAEPELLNIAVEESLRLEPAAGAVDRYATADLVLGDARISAGDLVRVSLTAANRDPDVFERPDDYVPTRPNLRSQLAFATGPHACIAMDLARLETVVAMRVLLDHLPGLRLSSPAPAVGLVFRKPSSVHVEWDAG